MNNLLRPLLTVWIRFAAMAKMVDKSLLYFLPFAVMSCWASGTDAMAQTFRYSRYEVFRAVIAATERSNQLSDASENELSALLRRLAGLYQSDRQLEPKDRRPYYQRFEKAWTEGLNSLSNDHTRALLQKEWEKKKLLAVGPFEYLRLSGLDNGDLTRDAQAFLKNEVEVSRRNLDQGFVVAVAKLPKPVQNTLGLHLGFPPGALGDYYTIEQHEDPITQLDRAFEALGGPLAEISPGETSFSRILAELEKHPQNTRRSAVHVAASINYNLEWKPTQKRNPIAVLQTIAASLPAQQREYRPLLETLCQQWPNQQLRLSANQIQLLRFRSLEPMERGRFHVKEFDNYRSGNPPDWLLGSSQHSLDIIAGNAGFLWNILRLELSSSQQVAIETAVTFNEHLERMADVLIDHQSAAVFHSIFLSCGPLNFFCSDAVRKEYQLSDREFEDFAEVAFRELREIAAKRKQRVATGFERILDKNPQAKKTLETNTGLSAHEICQRIAAGTLWEISQSCMTYESFYTEFPLSLPRVPPSDK